MNDVREATKAEIAKWDTHIQNNPGTQNFFQEKNFLLFKSQQHIAPWSVRYMVHTIQGKDIYVGYLVKRIFGLGEYWYAPCGPQASEVNTVKEIITQLKQIAPKAFTVLLEPAIYVDGQEAQAAAVAQLKGAQSIAPVQPNVHTVFVSLQPEDEMLMGFKQRTRRAIRQAEKAGVTVRMAPHNSETKDTFFNMYQETAKRAQFFIRKKSYYTAFWDRYHEAQQGSFFFAYKDGSEQPVAGVFVVHDDKKALYKDGASVRDGLPNGTLYFLQWKIMLWLQEKGVQEYDLHGVPPSWLQEDKTHRQYGLGIFKTSFGEISDQIGTLQWTLKPMQTKLWNIGVRRIYFAIASRRGGFFF